MFSEVFSSPSIALSFFCIYNQENNLVNVKVLQTTTEEKPLHERLLSEFGIHVLKCFIKSYFHPETMTASNFEEIITLSWPLAGHT